MNFILLSGGSGKRLWPLSNDIRSKQFIKIFQNENGDYESMVQRVYGQIKSADPEEPVVVCPVDPYVEADYFEALKQLSAQAEKGEANLVLMGIEPTYPSEKYGYILPEDKKVVASVSTFKEKPDKHTAELYIRQGALWNGGVFAYKLQYVLDKAHEMLDFTDYTGDIADPWYSGDFSLTFKELYDVCEGLAKIL